MRIGILETGAPPRSLRGRFGGYAEMTSRLLGPDFSTRAFDVRAGDLPERGDACDGWVLTGSSSGAYDPDPWIAALSRFVQDASGQAPMAGICFGHQLMAQAFGGRVIHSPKGRALGLHRYEIAVQTPWMDTTAPIEVAAFHGDQVVELAPGCAVLGGSDFTPFGLLAYPDRRAISIQLHPEFEPDFSRALVEFERPDVGDEKADAAIATFARPNDNARVGGWLRRFLSEG